MDRRHLAEERRQASLLGEIREAIFGAQDGLVSTLAVVSTVGGASADRYAMLIAGIASGLAGMFSMGAGEYMSSKSQREIFEAQIVGERKRSSNGRARPRRKWPTCSRRMASRGRRLPRSPPHGRASSVLLKTMVEKELGLTQRPTKGRPLQGALIMGVAFGLGAAVPMIPYCCFRSTWRSGARWWPPAPFCSGSG